MYGFCLFIVCVAMMYLHMPWLTHGDRENLWELVLSFYHMRYEDQMQIKVVARALTHSVILLNRYCGFLNGIRSVKNK